MTIRALLFATEFALLASPHTFVWKEWGRAEVPDGEDPPVD